MISRPSQTLPLVLACACLGWGASCDRVAEPEGRSVAVGNQASPAPAPSPSGSADAPPIASWTGLAAAPCVVPMADPPPPAQHPASECPAPPQPPPQMPRGSVTFPEASAAPRVTVELARTSTDRAHGLMYRRNLADDEGMLFSWRRAERRSFWMRNTCLPLDMVFIDANERIVGIIEQVPPLNDAPRSVPCPAQHVLELPAGWARKYGIQPGQRVTLEDVDTRANSGIEGP